MLAYKLQSLEMTSHIHTPHKFIYQHTILCQVKYKVTMVFDWFYLILIVVKVKIRIHVALYPLHYSPPVLTNFPIKFANTEQILFLVKASEEKPVAPTLDEDVSDSCCNSCPYSSWHWAGIGITITLSVGAVITILILCAGSLCCCTEMK